MSEFNFIDDEDYGEEAGPTDRTSFYAWRLQTGATATPMPTPPVVQNFVMHFATNTRLDCNVIEQAMRARSSEFNVTYDPRQFPAVVVRDLHSTGVAMLFGSGKLLTTGHLSAVQSCALIHRIFGGSEVVVEQSKVANIVATRRLNYTLDIHKLARYNRVTGERNSRYAEHEITQRRAGRQMKLRIAVGATTNKLGRVVIRYYTALVFASGAVLYAGPKSMEELVDFDTKVTRYLQPFQRAPVTAATDNADVEMLALDMDELDLGDYE